MGTPIVFKYDEKKTRVRELDESVEAGTPVLDPTDGRPAVAITNSGDVTKTITPADFPMGGGVTSITYANGGVGLFGTETTLAYDGTFDLPVGGDLSAIESGEEVFIGDDGNLSLDETGTAFGVVDIPIDYELKAGKLPVRIGD